MSAEVEGCRAALSACEAWRLGSVVPGSYTVSMQQQSPILQFPAYPRGALSEPVSWLVIPLSALAGEGALDVESGL